MVTLTGGEPGNSEIPEGEGRDVILKHLDARPKKVELPPEPLPAPPMSSFPPPQVWGRREVGERGASRK